MNKPIERKSGHSKLVYDKAKRTIVTVDDRPEASDSASDLVKRIEALEARLQSAERVVEAARKLVYEIDQTYDVDDGSPNYPFISEWQDLRDALADHDDFISQPRPTPSPGLDPTLRNDAHDKETGA